MSRETSLNTTVVPAEVDLELASERNKTIDRWRSEEISSELAYRALTTLYWRNQSTADDETRFYLRDTAFLFGSDIGMDTVMMIEIDDEISQKFD